MEKGTTSLPARRAAISAGLSSSQRSLLNHTATRPILLLGTTAGPVATAPP